MYCGALYTTAAPVDEPQNAESLLLVYCGTSCTAETAVDGDVDAPHYKPFYTVPIKYEKLA